MSELITGGIAAGALAACAACAGVVMASGYAVYRALSWLSEQGQREMERLEKEFGLRRQKQTWLVAWTITPPVEEADDNTAADAQAEPSTVE